MGNIKCFFIEPNGLEWRFLRRFSNGKCTHNENYGTHDMMHAIDSGPSDDWHLNQDNYKDQPWPVKCLCGYEFLETDPKQLFTTNQYISSEKPGELFDIRKAPVGAIPRNEWYEDIQSMRGIDNKSYTCETPGGAWHIDGIASNCTRPDDTVHKCWCRHGVVPNFTVNKVGNTCAAGAGSILIGNYHGFLINGELTNV